jgi:hypothetical protein
MKNTSKRAARLGTIFALLVAPLMLACSGEPSDAPPTTGAPITEGTPEQTTSGDELDKKNCVFIQFCNRGGNVICNTLGHDRNCSFAERTNECFRDANFVCGNDHLPIIEVPRACMDRCGQGCPCL